MQRSKLLKIICLNIILFLNAAILLSQGTSSVLSHNIPEYLRNGQKYSILVSFLNTGTSNWSSDDDYKLALYEQNDNMYLANVWGVRTVTLPNDVGPDEKATFNFEVTAPDQTGIYNCRWTMAKGLEPFGEITPAILVNVGAMESNFDPNFSAEFVTQSIPAMMVTGQKYPVNVTVRNTGKTSWVPNSDNGYKLVTINDAVDKTVTTDWSMSETRLNQSVEPGQTYTFQFDIAAPSTGSQTLQLVMMNGNNYFGERSRPLSINVVGTGTNEAKFNNSVFGGQILNREMTLGQTYECSVTMVNTGSTTWTRDKYKLVFVDPKINPSTINSFNVGYIELPKSVTPGETVTITFNVKSPNEPGAFPFQMSMMEGNDVFGEPTTAVKVFVK